MSDWKKSNIDYRDFRASKDGPEVPRGHRGLQSSQKRKKKRKDMARWCMGKEGVEHSVILVHQWHYIMKAQCSVCGRGEYNLSDEALAQVYERARNYVEYRELCKEFGHQFEKVETKWFQGTRMVDVCTICSYSKQVLGWEDIDKDSMTW
jgi:hypothetical protein